MAILAGTLTSERWLDEIIITASKSNVGADTADLVSLPAGIGDVAIMEVVIDVSPTATIITDAALANSGTRMSVTDAAGNVHDIIAPNGARWLRTGATRLCYQANPDPLVLWRQEEFLVLVYPELDTNGAPTDDHVINIKVVRVRPIEAPANSAIQLVR